MRIDRMILLPVTFGLVAAFWLSTLAILILSNAPLLAGPQDEADRALAFFLRDTVISFGLLVALFVRFRRGQETRAERDARPL